MMSVQLKADGNPSDTSNAIIFDCNDILLSLKYGKFLANMKPLHQRLFVKQQFAKLNQASAQEHLHEWSISKHDKKLLPPRWS